MKIKVDENLPRALVALLASYGHEADSVPDEGLSGCTDSDVWAASCRDGRFLITQDLDFSDIRQFAPGSHPGLLLLRLREPGRKAIMRAIENLLRESNLDNWRKCFVVVTDHKIRVRRPG